MFWQHSGKDFPPLDDALEERPVVVPDEPESLSVAREHVVPLLHGFDKIGLRRKGEERRVSLIMHSNQKPPHPHIVYHVGPVVVLQCVGDVQTRIVLIPIEPGFGRDFGLHPDDGLVRPHELTIAPNAYRGQYIVT